jgi:hypothetical protein
LAVETAIFDVVYEIARGQSMHKKQVLSKKKKIRWLWGPFRVFLRTIGAHDVACTAPWHSCTDMHVSERQQRLVCIELDRRLLI